VLSLIFFRTLIFILFFMSRFVPKMDHTGEASSRQRRQGSRWGGGAAGDPTALVPRRHDDDVAVSDDEALRALLVSAQERQQQQQQQQQQDRVPSNRKRGRDHEHPPRNNNNNSNNKNTTNNMHPKVQRLEENNSYYGPRGGGDDEERGGRPAANIEQDDDDDDDDKPSREGTLPQEDETKKPAPLHKPNFGLSGALAKDPGSASGGGGSSRVYKGVVLKFQEPPEARAPNTQWRFYVFKDKEMLETLHISKQSAYLCGRHQDICDICMAHPSLSSQHAVLQYRALPNKEGRLSCQPYIMDLESTNGTFINGIRIDSARYYQLKKGDVLTFGASKREYVLLTENTTALR
jgi:smad nuclear-interacting protein 1